MNRTITNDMNDLEPTTLEVDLPNWVLASLNARAKRIGIPMGDLIRIWIADKIDSLDRDDVKKAA
ncbi:MAG: hypothetical protein KF881_09835 [Acidobacteria bacterium]|nr:hypothetical protein [Acidobacteriota bacterium]